MTNRAIRWQLCVLLMAVAGAAHAQAPVKEIPLYPGAAPGSETWDWAEKSTKDKAGRPVVSDVVRPVLLHFPAKKGKAVGTAMIVAPGGGFRALMMSYEGEDVARRLNAMGLDAFVLKYRLTHTGPSAPAAPEVRKLAADDGRRAVQLVREKAGAFGYRPDRVGMIGYSAGGLVTYEALFGPAETRPDFAALIYGAGAAKGPPTPAPVPGGRGRRQGVRHPDGGPVHRLPKGQGLGRAARLPDGGARIRQQGGRGRPLPRPPAGVARGQQASGKGRTCPGPRRLGPGAGRWQVEVTAEDATRIDIARSALRFSGR
jgi:hypothetical protein